MWDAELTHPSPLCLQANALYCMGIANAVATGCPAGELYQFIRQRALDMETEPDLLEAVLKAEDTPPADYLSQAGWVLIALRNALWQLLHAPNFEEGVVDTIMRGGDTDTNAAICGALLGSVYGLKTIPAQWVDRVLTCRPQAGLPGVEQPRPECYWPVDALDLAEALVRAPLSPVDLQTRQKERIP
jgi:ADP-ribosylglycohydrolase